MDLRRPFPRKIALLGALYFVEGLPWGFQMTALPVYLRLQGVELPAIGFASLLSLPWMLKALWAPAVDRFGAGRLGRRRSWIVPTQAGLALACLAAAALRPDERVLPLLVLVFVMNLCAATMDIAVDGLAVDLLEPDELGYGNIAQVVGYKLGGLTGGGLLLWASARVGWSGLFAAMTGLVVCTMVLTLVVRPPAPMAAAAANRPQTVRAILAVLKRAFRSRGAAWVVALIATYKLGETMADLMFRPFLVDAGYTASQIGLWLGTWGMVFSLAGSFAGGVLASRVARLRAVGITAVVRIFPLIALWMLSLLPHPGRDAVIAVTAAENFFGGALTTALFAFMMSRVDRRIGATHYTVLATIEVLGKSVGAQLSGVVAAAFGYPAVFGAAVMLSAAYLGLLHPVRRATGQAPERP